MYPVCQAESHTTERAMASAVEKLTAIKLGRYIYIYIYTNTEVSGMDSSV